MLVLRAAGKAAEETSLVLPEPIQSKHQPAAQHAGRTAMPTLNANGIRIAFETFQDVVGLDPEFGCAPGGRDGTHAAAAQQHGLATSRHRGAQPLVERRIHRHAGPLLPGQRYRPRHLADPIALRVGADIDQHRPAIGDPLRSQRRRDVAGVTGRGSDGCVGRSVGVGHGFCPARTWGMKKGGILRHPTVALLRKTS